MKIYEMIYNKGLQESSHLFFDNNNIKSRKIFVKLMREEINQELINFEKNCEFSENNDLLNLFKEVWEESHSHLNLMENEFVETGKAILFDDMFLIVKEIFVIKI